MGEKCPWCGGERNADGFCWTRRHCSGMSAYLDGDEAGYERCKADVVAWLRTAPRNEISLATMTLAKQIEQGAADGAAVRKG